MSPSHAEELLAKAQEAQAAYWDALGELERELGIEIDGTQDLAEATVGGLVEEYGNLVADWKQQLGEEGGHPKVAHGRCLICGHYGEDCTGEEV